jgi:adenylate kinase
MNTRPDRAAWLQGPTAKCDPGVQPQDRPWRLILLGAPGVGKGTQAELLADRLGACHLSTGDVFRTAKSVPEGKRSPALAEALNCMKRGELVPDATVLNLVSERLGCLRCEGGFLLDGFPRTVAQAEALQEILDSEEVRLDAALDYELPLDEIVSRLSGRRTCAQCKAVYHILSKPPKIEGRCDHCGSSLIQRDDDQPAAIRVRMETYERSTAPLTEYFRKRGLLIAVPAHGSPEEILDRSLTALRQRLTDARA